MLKDTKTCVPISNSPRPTRAIKIGTPEPFALLNKIPIRDNGEPLIDLRIACPRLIIARSAFPYVRTGVAEMLNKAQDLLPIGYRLRIHSALRTLENQAEMYWRHYENLKEKNPEWPKSALRRACNKYFAAPDVKAPPGHCTGGAVDVNLCGPEGHGLDVTSPTKGWEAAYTYSEKLSPIASRNRRLLIETMFAAGFSNCRDEWWHWSYGDSAWAVRVGASVACYGLAPPPEGATPVAPSRPKSCRASRARGVRRSRPTTSRVRSVARPRGWR